ncbi:hypothetical protein DEU56DRAFT_524701 [Suillus clintonianus]|uniref:uncharacterized protein n=1 Tax=Suillus clintonianus TaxID=1904413 RepID=UPI001B87FABB|nr:uncharacterized protein DEU56DRAFT_524701 [Suillus clintonianus]KAG2127983.1 hypothetical protein DEU56DRAFT_524701 [Suillus clintonianus]
MIYPISPDYLSISSSIKRVTVDHEMKPNTVFLSLAEELQVFILSFLPYRDILHCTSICKALRQTYVSSSELQYIVELGGQHLLPVPNTDNHTPISQRLRLLRNKAHAWFKADVDSFEPFPIPYKLYTTGMIIASGHVYFWDKDDDTARIIPLLPKPPQQTFQRYWSPGTLCSVPHSTNIAVFMDPAQNLIAVAYIVDHKTTFIDLKALSVDGVHPRAAGQTMFLSGLPGHDDSEIRTKTVELKGLGRHIALERCLSVEQGTSSNDMWQLQIWDWQHSTTPNSVLSGLTDPEYGTTFDFCFLGDNRLLVLTNDLKIYSIEDMSQTPQLLACFLLPIPLDGTRFYLPLDQIQAQQSMYTSDPAHRILCIVAGYPTSHVFIISTKVFFDLNGIAATTPIPWENWGPSNTRVFNQSEFCAICGNRVLQRFCVREEYKLHVMDFSPLAVTNRRGLGRVVKEPSTIYISGYTYTPGDSLTTFLPYVEVVLDRTFQDDVPDIWIDEDRMYLFDSEEQTMEGTSTLRVVAV